MIPEIDITLKTVEVKGGKSIPLIRKMFLKRLPRKLKRERGNQGYINWLNEPITYTVGELRCYYHPDIEMEELLKKEITS